MRFKLIPALAVLAASLVSPALAADPENTLILTLKNGDVTIALRPDLAPKHVARIKELAREHAYDNVAFHRVIDGFMAQTGDVQFGDLNDGFDPRRVGTGGSAKPDLPAEFSSVPYTRGVVGMARSSEPNSANSQFFIMFTEYPSLNGQYTVVGEVEKGMDLVDQIKRGEPVQDPDRIVTAHIAADK